MMDWARYVLVMELHHAIKLRERFPAHEGKVLVLANFGGMSCQGPHRWLALEFRGAVRTSSAESTTS